MPLFFYWSLFSLLFLFCFRFQFPFLFLFWIPVSGFSRCQGILMFPCIKTTTDFESVQNIGVSITFETEKVTIKALYVPSLDLPAKAMILEFIAHNGYYSCSYCDDPGHAPKNKKGRRQHAFAYGSNGNLRTNEQWKMDALKAVETKRMVIIELYNAKQ